MNLIFHSVGQVLPSPSIPVSVLSLAPCSLLSSLSAVSPCPRGLYLVPRVAVRDPGSGSCPGSGGDGTPLWALPVPEGSAAPALLLPRLCQPLIGHREERFCSKLCWASSGNGPAHSGHLPASETPEGKGHWGSWDISVPIPKPEGREP